jgi:hypothetical protein
MVVVDVKFNMMRTIELHMSVSIAQQFNPKKTVGLQFCLLFAGCSHLVQ